MNDEKYPFWKFFLLAFLGAFVAWCFFFVKGFAYDLELGNYDFNGFDENADFIFEDFIENDMNVYNNTEYENLVLLKSKLIENGYTDDYINQFRIKVQTTVNESYATGPELDSDPSSITELTEENGATDAIIRETNEEIPADIQENFYSSQENTFVSDDTQAILDLLEDMSDQLATLNRLTSENQAYYLADREEDTQSIYDKEINDFTVMETIGLIIIFALLGGGVVWFVFKFSPHYGR